jgi:hypothetical protein
LSWFYDNAISEKLINSYNREKSAWNPLDPYPGLLVNIYLTKELLRSQRNADHGIIEELKGSDSQFKKKLKS